MISELGAVFAEPRRFFGNQFVYAVITSRAHGLSVGVNINPDQLCNFDCVYCEVRREPAKAGLKVDIAKLAHELIHILVMAQFKQLGDLEQFSKVPSELMVLKEVALSGDGEPTLAENFHEIVSEVVRIRRLFPPFKLVLITNGTGLNRPVVQKGLDELSVGDEIWIKLDAGTEEFMHRMNGTKIPIETVLSNILELARLRPVIIQSLFCLLEGHPPCEKEIDAYIGRLLELKTGGAQIPLVQIYSTSRTPARPGCKHLPLAGLSHIARRVRTETGLHAEVF